MTKVSLVADLNPHRIALRLPFEAFMPGDVFPSSCEPRFATGDSQPAPIEDTHRNRDRRNEPHFKHAPHSAGLSQQALPLVKELMEPGL